MAPTFSPTRWLGLRSILALLTLLLVATACAATPSVTVTRAPTAAELAAADEAAKRFEATPAYLARVQQRTNQAKALRFEVFTAIDTSLFDMGSRTVPVMSGEQVGNRSRIFLDLSGLMGPMAASSGFDRNAMTMTMVTDGDVLYLNAPFLAEMTDVSGLSADPDFAWVRDLILGWGRLDIAELGGTDMMSDMGVASGADATDMLALLNAAGVVLDGGRDEVRGVGVNVAYTEVSIVDVLQASGQDLGDLGVSRGQRDMVEDLNANVAVSVDDEGMVRRVEYTIDFSSLVASDPQLQNVDLTMWQRVDFFDFGADIDVAVPVTAIDITSEFEDLLDELN